MQVHLLSKLTSGFHRLIRAKLIFNPGSGQPGESPLQLVNNLSEMQDQQILPEVYTTRPDSQLEDVVHSAIKSGIKLVVVAGGDGTIDSVVSGSKSRVFGAIPMRLHLSVP